MSPGGRALPRIGVVGVGSLGYHHARILAGLEGVRMAGVYDADEARAAEVAAAHGVRAHASLGALLEAADAVVVAVPTVAHEAVAVAALERGVHVLIEKPMASSLAEADRILEAARRGGALVQIGHVERFNAAVRAAAPYLEEPLFVESHRMAPFVPRSIDVAVVLDLMIHDVDLVGALVGRPVRAIAATGIPVLTGNVDIANARLEFEGGAVANLTASRVSTERKRKVRIFQRSGYLSLDLAAGVGEFLRLKRALPVFEAAPVSGGGHGAEAPGEPDGGRDAASAAPLPAGGLEDVVERIPLQGDGVEPLRLELEAFRDAVRGERAPAVDGEQGRQALALSLSIQERIESHVADTRPS
ncbi:MAG: gfo/Idh/MocA family oxidoreductase [Gemmatimonadetes bacterium]|nr:MAG: gfo/Idh/MocA family oxidoreductase [Gemmatimonadota bacterium]